MRMKVKITMEADVTDLPAFNEELAGRENVYDVMHDLYSNSILRLMKEIADAKDNPTDMQKALIKQSREDEKLTGRLVNSIKIEYT